MNSQMINTMVLWLPTILVALMLLWSILGGLNRGFRKSLILFIHYIIALGIGIGIFYFVSRTLWDPSSTAFASLYKSIGNLAGYDFSSCGNIYDVVQVIMLKYLPDYADLATINEYQQATCALVGCMVNFVLGIICLYIIPWMIRILLYLIYLIFYSEGKHKRRVKAKGDTYHKHPWFGLLVGAAKGIVISTLSISLISSTYFIISGGVFYENQAEADKAAGISNIVDMKSFGIDLESYGIDLDGIFKAIKSTRFTGVGSIYNNITIDGEPIDLYWNDLMFSSSFKTMKEDSNGNPIEKKLYIRKEISTFTGLLNEIVDAGIIQNVDGTITVNAEALDKEFGERISACVKQSVLLSDIIPMFIVGTAYALKDDMIDFDSVTTVSSKQAETASPTYLANEGDTEDDALLKSIKDFFTDERIEKIKNIDFAADMEKLVNLGIKVIEIIPTTDTGSIDLTAFNDVASLIDMLTNKETIEKVKGLFNDLSEIKTLTEALLPIGVTVGSIYLEQSLPEGTTSSLDLNGVNWKSEIANFGNIFEAISDLDLDFKCLIYNEPHVEEGASPTESSLSPRIQYLIDLSKSTNFKNKIGNVVDSVFGDKDSEKGSYLLSMITASAIKYATTRITLGEEEQPDGTTKQILLSEKLKDSLEAYTATNLKDDMKNIADSCVSAIPLFVSLFEATQSEDFNLLKTFIELDVEPLRGALIGKLDVETSKYKGGIYDLNLFAYTKDGKKESHLDDILPDLLMQYLGSYIEQSDVDSVTDWRNELSALVDSVEALQEIEGIENIDTANIINTLPQISDENVDKLSSAVSKSVIVSGVLIKTLVDTLDGIELLQYKEDNGAGEKVVKSWKEGKDKAGNPIAYKDAFDGAGNVTKYGEINALLKIVVMATSKDSSGNPKLDLNNITIDAVSKLTKDDADTMTNSKIIESSLSNVMKELLGNVEGLTITIPDDVEWANQYDEYNNLTNTGELWALIQILQIDAFKKDNGDGTKSLEINNLTSLDSWKKLDTTSPVDDVDKLLASKIIKTNLPGMLDTMIGSSLGYTSRDADGNKKDSGKEVLSDCVDNWGTELRSLIKIMNDEELSLIDSDGNFNSPSLDTMANSIVKNPDDSYNYDSALNLAKSKILCKVMSKKISELTEGSSSSLSVIVPSTLKDADESTSNWLRWSYEGTLSNGSEDYMNGQLIKLIKVLHFSKEALQNGGAEVILTSGNLASGMIKMNNHDMVVESEVFYATISNTMIENSTGSDPSVKIRTKAYISDNPATEAEIKIKSGEVVVLLDGIKALGITDINDISLKISDVMDEIEESETRRLICTSNILNITFVDKLITTNGLEIPTEYNTTNAPAWYPLYTVYDPSSESDVLKKNSWKACELNLSLVGATELNHYGEFEVSAVTSSTFTTDGSLYMHGALGYYKVTSGEFDSHAVYYKEKEAGLIVSDSTMTFNTNRLLKSLANDANSDSSREKIDVVYDSEVMAYNITKKIKKQEENGTIKIRNCAYVDSDTNKTIKKNEVIILIDFLNDTELDIEATSGTKAINAENILALIDNVNYRASICFSNILNISAVDKITSGSGSSLKIPASLRVGNILTGAVDLDAAKWYPEAGDVMATYSTWKDCELNMILVAVYELDVHATGNSVSVNTEDIVNKLNDSSVSESGKTKIDVIYDGLVFSYTISDYIMEAISVPTAYLECYGAAAIDIIDANNIIVKDEVIKVTTIIGSDYLNITFNETPGKNKPSDIKPSTVLSLSQAKIEYITSSAIIGLRVSNALVDAGSLTIPSITMFATTNTKAETIHPIYSNELAELLLAIKAMNFDVDNSSTFNLSAIDSGELELRLGLSTIFHATMSEQLTSNLANVPETFFKTYVDDSSYVTIRSTLGVVGNMTAEKYVSVAEIKAFVVALQDLGITDANNATSTVDSSFLATLTVSQVSRVGDSALMAALITENLDKVEKPNTKKVQNTVDLANGSSMAVINGDELTKLLQGIINIGVTAVDASHISISSIDLLALADAIDEADGSYILRATISMNITGDDYEDIPYKDVDGVDLFDGLDYLKSTEIIAVISAFKDLGLEYDSINADYITKTMTISTIKAHLSSMLASAIIHNMISENLIIQEVILTGIVPKTYFADNTAGSEFEVGKNVSGTFANALLGTVTSNYVTKVEVENAINALNAIGIDKVNEANSIGVSHIATVASDATKTAAVKNSAVISAIFSIVMISNHINDTINTYRTLHSEPIFTPHTVDNMKSGTVDIYSQADIELMLQIYAVA